MFPPVKNNTTIRSWDATSGKHVLTYTIPADVGITTGFAWSPDGKSLAATSNFAYQATATHHPTLQVFDAKTAALKSSTSLGGLGLVCLHPSWSPDSQFLAVACNHLSSNYMLNVWNVTTGEMVKSISVNNLMDQVKWAPHGKLLAISGYTFQGQKKSAPALQVWDSTTWNLVQQYPNVLNFSWSPDGQQIALVDVTMDIHQDIHGKDSRIVNAASGKTVKQLAQGDQDILDIGWSPDSSRIAITRSQSNTVQFWSPVSGKVLSTVTGDNFDQIARAIVWSPGSKYIVSNLWTGSAPDGGPEIVVWVAK